jgi:hypothetical protein
VSRFCPLVSSVPMEMISTFMQNSAKFSCPRLNPTLLRAAL